jgi:hypothetical protein
MKPSRSEYVAAILETLIKSGPCSKYAISKGTGIPYPTVLRKLPEMEKAHIIFKVGEGKRNAEIYVATPKGTLTVYFSGRVRTSELFMALPSVMRYVPLSLEELPAVKNPFDFMVGDLLFKSSHLEDLTVKEAVSILGAILIWRHDEWYHELGREKLKSLLTWDESYHILRFLVAGSIGTLKKLNEQTKELI